MTLTASLSVDCTTVFDIEHRAHRCRELEGCRTHRPRMAGPSKLSCLLVGGLEYCNTIHPAPTHIMCLGLRSGVSTSPLAGHLPRRGCLQRRCSDSLFNKEMGSSNKNPVPELTLPLSLSLCLSVCLSVSLSLSLCPPPSKTLKGRERWFGR